MFQSTNIKLANAKHCTNITNLHEQKTYDIQLNMSYKHQV
jgi:hypothetical protein